MNRQRHHAANPVIMLRRRTVPAVSVAETNVKCISPRTDLPDTRTATALRTARGVRRWPQGRRIRRVSVEWPGELG